MLLDASQPSRSGCSPGKRQSERHRRGRWSASQVWVSLEITKRQLGALASSVTPAATSGRAAPPQRASVSAHAGLRSIRKSTVDFDKVRIEEQQADWHDADDLMLSCWWPCHAQHLFSSQIMGRDAPSALHIPALLYLPLWDSMRIICRYMSNVKVRSTAFDQHLLLK